MLTGMCIFSCSRVSRTIDAIDKRQMQSVDRQYRQCQVLIGYQDNDEKVIHALCPYVHVLLMEELTMLPPHHESAATAMAPRKQRKPWRVHTTPEAQPWGALHGRHRPRRQDDLEGVQVGRHIQQLLRLRQDGRVGRVNRLNEEANEEAQHGRPPHLALRVGLRGAAGGAVP